jgi:hypothetical protein
VLFIISFIYPNLSVIEPIKLSTFISGSLRNSINTGIFIFMLTSIIPMQCYAEWQKYLFRKQQIKAETVDQNNRIIFHKTGLISIVAVSLAILQIILLYNTPEEYRDQNYFIAKVYLFSKFKLMISCQC